MPTQYQQAQMEQIDQSPVFARFVQARIEEGEFVRLVGLAGSAKTLVAARMQQRLGRPVLVVTADAETSEAWSDDLEHFGVAGAGLFPMAETLPYEPEEPVIGIIARQYATLYGILTGEDAHATAPSGGSEKKPLPFIVAPVEALQRKVLSPEALRERVLKFAWGEGFDLDAVIEKLVDMGYERESMTEARGEFSVRGHIVDIFSPQYDFPIRFDLFGDEIESIRFFDPTTQRSFPDGKELEQVVLLPASVTALSERLAHEDKLVGLDEWLSAQTVAVFDAPENYDTELERFDRIATRRRQELDGAEPMAETVEFASADAISELGTTDGQPPAPHEALFRTQSQVRRDIDRYAQVHIPKLDIQDSFAEEQNTFDFGVTSYESIPADIDAYLSVIRKRQSQDFSVHVVCDNAGQVQRLSELLAEHEIPRRPVLNDSKEAAEYKRRDILEGYADVVLTVGPMHTGFIFPEARLMIVTDREMFGRYKRRPVYRKAPKGKAIASVAEIKRGDYVVHADHGVGQFLGIRKQNLDGRETELLEIEYSDENKLLVPLDKVAAVQKYTSVEGKAPTLDKMGGKRWQTRKRKSQEKIEEMAKELLELYAKREMADGYAFGSDTVWQQEFEDSFLYTETGDQMRSIEEIKNDMTSERPMDRLLCGDVGFGKTEVAMRAVFKAVQDKKQVAVLVPTTILAQQHYTTFTERFAEYPVTIRAISRFRTATEVKETLKGLKSGEVDVVIGTHRLLSKDVSFLDLGLLVVDEEHRFGVKQKEKIKALRASVDVLTLSATPIPRTLHLALSGLRDMSTINTPPRDRQPIRTRVIRFVPEEIEEAVVRELNRGGQIYFVHNRVQSIQSVADRLAQIVPQARIAIGHGQMPERELEKVMFDFIDHKYDILLATTIIESGLDIPNVNTMIINRADAFGLAQLYQLRGRIGRDVRRAYAYLIIPEGRPITDTAVKRLRAIEEFTELGMGFQIAMRDLEIRGTGNLLGSEQHGTIEAVGFELYCQMLEEAVSEMQGGKLTRGLDLPVEIRWSAPALLPAEYVPVESQRIGFYKRLSGAREEQEVDDVAEELRDRYGKIPRAAQNLLDVSRLRILGRRARMEKIASSREGFRLTPRGDLFDLLRRAQNLPDVMKKVKAVEAGSEGNIHIKIKKWDESAEAACEVMLKLMG
ncbi:MAG: transcription-repair coupling factor [Candidatus Sumerlaeota bacterium]